MQKPIQALFSYTRGLFFPLRNTYVSLLSTVNCIVLTNPTEQLANFKKITEYLK